MHLQGPITFHIWLQTGRRLVFPVEHTQTPIGCGMVQSWVNPSSAYFGFGFSFAYRWIEGNVKSNARTTQRSKPAFKPQSMPGGRVCLFFQRKRCRQFDSPLCAGGVRPRRAGHPFKDCMKAARLVPGNRPSCWAPSRQACAHGFRVLDGC